MTGLETKLNAILNDKLTNLTPENLKKGVTCLGVEGTLEPNEDLQEQLDTQDNVIKELQTSLENKASGTLDVSNNDNISIENNILIIT